MSYTQNPNMPKVRMETVRLVKYRGWSMRKVALRYGVEPSTISRWCKHPSATGWVLINTESSRPLTSPGALSEGIIRAIIQKRIGRKRCGQVIHQELKRDGVTVSLSSVQRTLERLHLLKKRSPWKRPHDKTLRPEIIHAGSLLEADTVHILAPDGARIYIYTLIDLFTRWAYAEAVEKIGAEESAGFILRAKKFADFDFEMIQTDHGSEFSTRFTHVLWRNRMRHRHSRVRQSNDNAHIERFNRTIQEECLDRTTHTLGDFRQALKTYLPYYNNERLHMGINYQTPLEVLRRS
jgi:transposase InsO family protein